MGREEERIWKDLGERKTMIKRYLNLKNVLSDKNTFKSGKKNKRRKAKPEVGVELQVSLPGAQGDGRPPGICQASEPDLSPW